MAAGAGAGAAAAAGSSSWGRIDLALLFLTGCFATVGGLAASSTGRAAARVGDTKTDVSLTRLPLTRDSPPPSMSTASSVAVAGAAAGLAVAVVVAGG